MGLLFVYLSIALVFSFLCSILEASLLSTTHSFIQSRINEGKKHAKQLKKFKDNIDLPLAAILTINTAAHTLGAAGVGAQAQHIWGNKYVSLVSILLTLSILIFSEIIPKTLGAIYWKRMANFTSNALVLMIYSPLYPIIILSKFLTGVFKGHKNDSVLSRAEFQAIAEKGIEDGVFQDKETLILKNFIKFNKIIVKSIMTPRTIIIAANEEMNIKAFYDSISEINVSRIPVYSENIDNITGFILKDELLQNIINNAEQNKLKTIKRNILLVNENLPIIKLFYKLINQKVHIANVVGEYGETVGIVTMEDIIETLIGVEIMDEQDDVEDMQVQARKNWEDRMKRMGLINDDAAGNEEDK
jgi:CBS domain containing-hemolysin-like protein